MTRLAIKRPLLTFVVFLVLVLLGFMTMEILPLDLMPNVTLPSVSVVTLYPGSTPEDVEKLVTEPLEEAISTVPDLNHVTSYSQEGVSAITAEFNWGADLNVAVNDLRDRLDIVKKFLPGDAEEPLIFKFDISQWPILIVAASAIDSTIDLRYLIEDQLVDELKRARGVGAVQIWGGGKVKQINVHVDKARLEGYGLTMDRVVQAISLENIGAPVGDIKVGVTDFSVRVPAEFQNVNEIEDVPITLHKGAIIRLRDIARVEEGFQDPINYVRVNKREGVFFAIQKQSGANTVDVAKAASKKLKEFEKDHPGVKLKVVMDGSLFIKNSIHNLTKTILVAGILVILVTLFLLQNLTGSLIIATTIPVSLIVAFIFLYLMGATINIVSLSSLAIAIGMVVDSAIVVLENIFYHRERGETRKEAALFGTSEVAQAITASTLTSISIMIPVIVVKGFVGVMFKQLALTVILVLLTSLFAALTLTPMMASVILRIKKSSVKKGLSYYGERGFQGIENFYRKVLTWSLKHRWWVVLLGLIIFIFGLGLFKFIPTEFLPTSDTGDVRGSFSLARGTRLEVTDSVMHRVEKIIEEKVPESEIYVTRAGPTESGFGAIMGRIESSSSGFFSIHLKERSKRKRGTKEVAYLIEKELKKIPGVENPYVSVSGGANEFLFGAGKPVSIEIYGHDFNETDSIAKLLKTRMEKVPGLVAISISREKRKPELWVKIDRAKASAYGLSVAQIAQTLRLSIYGNVATTLRRGKREIDVFARLDDSSREDPSILQDLLITTPLGAQIPIANVATIEKAFGPVNIEHKDRERIVKVEADIYKRPLGAVMQDVKNILSDIAWPRDLHWKIGGTAEQQATSFNTLLLAAIFGVLLVYLVMVALYESFVDPFIIMFAVPFAIVGVSLAFFITRQPFSLMGFVGVLMLIGIVVNNAIVMVDYTHLLRERGVPFEKAVLEGGIRRLRPILMTALTTIFGLLPLAISKAVGAEMWNALGISVIGGLIFSSFVTLIFVPVLYSIIRRPRRKTEKTKE